MSVPASHFPLLAALDRLGPLSVGELAQAVGISQPGVSRMLENLQSDGFVTSQRRRADRRLRPIVLTKAGQQLIARAKQLTWPRIEAAVAERGRGRIGTAAGTIVRVGCGARRPPLCTFGRRLSGAGSKERCSIGPYGRLSAPDIFGFSDGRRAGAAVRD